jgi:transitional endoplasmic reticulum ATPase
MTGCEESQEQKRLNGFKEIIKRAEEADSEEKVQDWLLTGLVMAERMSEEKHGEEADRWEKLGEKCREKIKAHSSEVQDSPQSPRSSDTEKPKTTDTGDSKTEGPVNFQNPPDQGFDDVGGMDDLISTLEEKVIHQLQDSPYKERLKVSPTNGLLMQGPPGTGKTYISKSLAGEIGYKYAEVQSSDLINSYVGETGKSVDALFSQIRDNQPCLVFIDEIEAITTNRKALSGKGGDKAYQQAISEFLQGLDSLQDTDAVVVAATNLIDQIDGAILRSGRFDEKIEVPPPDRKARCEILQIHLEDRETDGSFNWDRLADKTEDFSAADLAKSVKAAAQEAHLQSVKANSLQPINQDLLLRSIRKTEPSLKHWDNA